LSTVFFLFPPLHTVSVLFGNTNTQLMQKQTLVPLVFFVFSLFVLIAFVRKIHINTSKITILYNIFACTLFCVPLFLTSYKYVNRMLHPVKLDSILTTVRSITQGNKPDVYYIIIDRYANNRTLKNIYSYDNTQFTDSLKAQGFYVAEKSVANYPFTLPSLASSLNMMYLDDVDKQAGKASYDKKPLLDLIENNELIRFFKKNGYSYIHIGSSSDYTSRNKNADVSYIYEPRRADGVKTYLDTLMNNPNNYLARYIGTNLRDFVTTELTKPQNQGNYLIDQMLKISEIPQAKGPKFVFIHSLFTHEPYVFDRDGKYTPSETINSPLDTSKQYIEQLQFANKLIVKMIETIKKNSTTPPIIILQSDEGPYPLAFRQLMTKYNWRNAPPDVLKEKLRILNAYYLPDSDTKGFYDSISPVNSFRLILNRYFGSSLPILPDNAYIQAYSDLYYEHLIVSEIVKIVN
jgi:hypothetical protein